MRFIIAASLLFLAACADKPFMPLGDTVAAPSGAVDYCKRHPGDELCGARQ